MLIHIEKYQEVRCPFLDGRNCLGPRCAVWRIADQEHGYCGAGGPVLHLVVPQAARIEKNIVPSPGPKMVRR